MSGFETIDAGGKSVRMYVAGDTASGASAVLVLHPWWGLNDDVVAYADRLAAAGFKVAAPDLYGDGQVASTIEDAEKLMRAADEDAVNVITLAVVDDLARRLGPGAKIGALGFSFGAHWAVWAPTQRDSVAATVLYYGTTGDNLTASSVPVLGHFAEADPYETTEWVDEFARELRSAGRDVVIHRYANTGHWFAEPSRDAYQEEAADLAFVRTIDFLRSQL